MHAPVRRCPFHCDPEYFEYGGCPGKEAFGSTKSCVSGDCHAKVVNHKYLHGPMKIGQCTVCHAPLPGTDHKFKLLETEARLCLMCHKNVDTKGYLLHDPVAKGKCLGCHDPHGSEEPSMIIKSPAGKLCNDCHNKKPVLTRKYAHKPVAEGKCLSCHQPHGSKATKLLDSAGSKLCLQQCHEKMRPTYVAGKEQKVHLASEACAKCHRSHDSNYPSLLTRSPSELCLDGCHKEIKENLNSSAFKHDAMTKEMACAECHKAHDNKFGHMLRKPATDLCYTCHDKMQNQVEAAKFKHRPVADKSCLSCHTPHNSNHSGLLFADFPSGMSAAYSPAAYAVCFSCHSAKITRERYTTSDTDFRNGRLNLHYLHVNKERGGQTCRACHNDHAGSQPKLIRDKEPFGSWEALLRYKKSDTGGSCLAGCHGEYSYDRVKPVQLRAQ
jgi:predicted CXXCH cytochrome family protein